MPLAAVRASRDAFPETTPRLPARTLSWAAAIYIGLVIAAGAAILVLRWPTAISNLWLAGSFLIASLVLSTFKLRLPLGRSVSTLSMACAADLTALMVMGADVAMVTASAGVLMQCTVRVRQTQPLYRAAFSVAAVVITAQAAGLVWTALDGELLGLTTLMLPLAMTTMTYYVVNTSLVAGAIAVSSHDSPIRTWRREFFWSAPSYLLSGAAAAVVGLIIVHAAFVLLPLAFIPLYVSYRAYQMSLERLDEERRHATELARLVDTTREALGRATQSEAALAAEKDRLALESSRLMAMVQSISDGVMMVGRDGSILLMNDEARRLAGTPAPHPGEPPIAAILAALGFSRSVYTDAIARVWQSGESVRLVNDARRDDASPLVEVMGTPTRDTDGRVAGAAWVLRDITEIARVEQERAKAAHLESLGVLAGGLAHDFNNILTGIVGNLSLVQDQLPADQEPLRRRLAEAAAACGRARGVTSQLLTFAKGGAPVKTAASMRELVVECTRFVLSGSQVAPRFEINPDLWNAEIDTNQIAEVIHNVVLNALQAMPEGGVITVVVDNLELTPETAPAETGLAPGRYVRVRVRDTGTGISPEHVSRIFDPYFTTKKTGSGLGLAISYSIVRAHGGAITVESEVGRGTTFTMYLPASFRSPVAESPVAQTAVMRGGHLLLMDDDAMVAEVAEEMLESLGFRVEVAVSGTDAIDRFAAAEARKDPFDLVILDLTVPGGMGGAQAVHHIRNIRRDVTVYVTSGYTDDSVLARYQDCGFDGVLPKPFALPDLRRAFLGTRER